MSTPQPHILPIEEHVAPFIESMRHHRSGVVVAAPGAGKTTVVPRRLLEAPWLRDSSRPGVILVQPRRVAVLQAAQRIAAGIGEPIGGRVGLRMRDDTRVSSATRLTVMTEGVFLRMVQHDPLLTGIGVVVLDEFHERSLDIDIACALTLSARGLFVPDLKIVAMSATLDVEAVSGLFELDGPIASLQVDAAQFPVDVTYRPPGETAVSSTVGDDPVRRRAPTRKGPIAIRSQTATERLAEHAAIVCIEIIERGARDAADDTRGGDILVFLPGVHEIRVAGRFLHRWLTSATLPVNVAVLELHGRAPTAALDRALAKGRLDERRIVLATSVAQTSLTIDGVTTVVDTGLIRRPTRDASTGLSRLTTHEVSHATAEQRSGRAGRTAPGDSIRLWSKANHAQRDHHDRPAISEEDLSPLVLLLAAWGQAPSDLRWCDAPSEEALTDASTMLRRLGILDAAGDLTPHGQLSVSVPAHPRLASMLVRATKEEQPLAAAIVALLSDAQPWRGGGGPTHLGTRLHAVFLSRTDRHTDDQHADDADYADDADELDPTAAQRIRRSAMQLLTQLGRPTTTLTRDHLRSAASLLLFAYPDRLGVRLPDHPSRYRFASGLTLDLHLQGDNETNALAGALLLVACDVDSDRRRGRIRVAVPLSMVELAAWVDGEGGRTTGAKLLTHETATFEQGQVSGATSTMFVLGSLQTEVMRVSRPATPQDRARAFAHELETRGAEALHWSDATHELAARMMVAHAVDPTTWPRPDNQQLCAHMIADLNSGHNRSTRPLDPMPALTALLAESPNYYRFSQEVPESITLESGVAVRLRYRDEHGDAIDAPTARVRVQDVFGATTHPAICHGALRVRLELLSPAQRVIAVTDDINRFWDTGYASVRAEMRGRYPKHAWPENPRLAEPRRPRPAEPSKS